MTTTSMTFGRPTRLQLPQASNWLAAGATRLISALRRLDRWLLAQADTEPRNAEEMLEWASRIEASEPGFAADLRAAALRSMDAAAR